MIKKLFIILLTFAQFCASGQTFQIGHITVTFVDSSRSNRAVATEIYYPADVAGDNQAFASTLAVAPVISFGHGFVMTYDAYFNFRDLLVPKGYILAFPKTEGSLSPSHSDFGKDLSFVLKSINKQGLLSSSILYGKVDTFNCVMGHSMGGGASLLAVQSDPSIKSIVTFAAAETTPSAIAASSAVKIPALFFAGVNDCVSPPVSNQQPMYVAAMSDCKHYIGIKGGSHCQMAESNVACSFGEATCSPAPTISRATQHKIIDSYLLPWLDYTLKASCTSGLQFNNLLAADTSVSYLKNCNLCNSSSVANLSASPQISVYPNPSADWVSFDHIPLNCTQLVITNITGENIATYPLQGRLSLSVKDYASGIYLYKIIGHNTAPIVGKLQVRH